jgi:hypothetical protein
METFLGLLGVAVYIVGVIALAAVVTWAVVKISPSKDKPGEVEEA